MKLFFFKRIFLKLKLKFFKIAQTILLFSSLLILTMCCLPDNESGSLNQNSTATYTPHTVSLKAWVAENDFADLTFEGVKKDYEFYSTRDSECNILNLETCNLISNNLKISSTHYQNFLDLAFNTKNSAWYIFRDPVFDKQIKKYVSFKTFSERSAHQVVVFKDPNNDYQETLFLIGGIDSNGFRKNDVWKSTDAIFWRKIVDDNTSPFAARDNHQVVVYKDPNNDYQETLFLIGGRTSENTYKNDVWKSTNGVDWTEVEQEIAFTPRYGHQVVVFKDPNDQTKEALFIIDGAGENGTMNDIRISCDGGKNWSQISKITNNETYAARYEHQVIVNNDTLFLHGGATSQNGVSGLVELWKSNDGITWERIVISSTLYNNRLRQQFVVYQNEFYLIAGSVSNTDNSKSSYIYKSSDNGLTWVANNTNFSARYDHQALVFKDKIYLIGGGYYYNDEYYYNNDTWVTTDGENWLLPSSIQNKTFTSRKYHKVINFNDELYLIGGDDGEYKNDVWKSTDGIEWTEVTSDAAFSPRYGHEVVIFKDQLYLIGGYAYNREEDRKELPGDIWKSTDGLHWEEVISGVESLKYTNFQAIVTGFQIVIVESTRFNRLRIFTSDQDATSWTTLELDSISGFNFDYFSDFQLLYFNGNYFIIGGYGDNNLTNKAEYNDKIYTSNNKESWVASTTAPFKSRGGQAFVYNNAIYYIGGYYYDSVNKIYYYYNDVWRSEDGKSWVNIVDQNTSFYGYAYHQAVVLGGNFYLIGGKNSNGKSNDIWKSTDGGKTWKLKFYIDNFFTL